jgi:hypothetical protein
MLAYLLEYYSENSMDHIGWMINVTKILPKLSKHDYGIQYIYYIIISIIVTFFTNIIIICVANYMGLLLHKPCFGEMGYNFPNKRFKALSVNQDTLEVYIPLTQLISTDHLAILEYAKYEKMR